MHHMTSIEEIIKTNTQVAKVTEFHIENKVTLRHFKLIKLFEFHL